MTASRRIKDGHPASPVPGGAFSGGLRRAPGVLRCMLLLWLAALVLPAFCPVLAQQEGVEERSRHYPPFEERRIVAAMQIDSYPYSYADPAGVLRGFSVDILDAVSRAMDLGIDRVYGPAGELNGNFRQGAYDMIQVIGQDAGHGAGMDLSAAFLNLEGVVYVRRRHEGIRGIQDLNGRNVVIINTGGGAMRVLEENGISAEVIQASSAEKALHALNEGRHDAVLVSRLTAQCIIGRDRLADIVELRQPATYEVRHSFAVHKGDAELLARLNEGLAVLYRTGEYYKIYDRWFSRYEPRVFTWLEVTAFTVAILAVALLVVALALVRQRRLAEQIRRQARRLGESEAVLAEAQRVALLGYWRMRAGPQGEVELSPESLRILGRSAGGGPRHYHDLLDLVAEGSRRVFDEAVGEVLALGKAFDVRVVFEPAPGVQKYVHSSGRPVRDAAGHTAGLFGTLQDVTQQVFAEEEMRRNSRLLNALYENVPCAMGVVEAGEEGCVFVSANPETGRMLGRPGMRLEGRSLAGLGLAGGVQRFWDGIFRRGGGEGQIQHAVEFMEALRRYYSITLVGLDSGADRRRLCFLVQDITERRQMDAEIAQGRRLRAVGELVGGIAHEFNNLLTPIIMQVEVFDHQFGFNASAREGCGVIRTAAERATELTRRLLTFGRRMESRREQVRLQVLVDGIFELLRNTIDRRISLHDEISRGTPPLHLNQTDVHQIVFNLLLNARDTLMEKLGRDPPAGWTPWIKVSVKGYPAGALRTEAPIDVAGWQRLTVEDNGMGMKPDVVERIFEPFYTTKEVGKGTGLGLATVWHLSNAIGGRVDVDSTPGEGTSFHVWLPVHPPPPPSAATPAGDEEQAAAAVPVPGAKHSILLVEDDELVAGTIKGLLLAQEHKVTHSGGGKEGCDMLCRSPGEYTLLICDLNLPGLSGIELIRRARKVGYAGAVLVISGRFTREDHAALKELGVDRMLEKPFNFARLQQAIAACMKRKG